MKFGAVGFEFGIAVVGGYFVGRWLDTKYQTEPILAVSLMALGTAAAFVSLVRTAKKAMRLMENESNHDSS